MTYAETHYGQTTVTTYTYDATNQLLTATEDEIVWQYSYDGNGSLIQTNPGASVANGSTRYTYNTAGYLTKVENYTLTGTGTTEWQTQSEMTYDGLGNRLEVTTYTDGEGNTTRYVLDGGAELTAIGTDNTTYYLYGMGAIGTLGESWSYMLQDGAGSTRQLVDEEGTVNLSVSYTPWGDTMEIYGSGMLNLGYLGGVYDAGTGLIYMGNGQYYDPSTGRFLTRGAQQDQSNPYTPWNSDPAGMLIAPLALLALVFGRKKTRTKFDQFVILLVLVITVSLSFTISLPVKAQSISSSTTSTSSNTMPLGYVTVTIGGTHDKDIASNPGSGVKTFRFAIRCNEEQQSSSRVILFGGTSNAETMEGADVKKQLGIWLTDGDGNVIPDEQLIKLEDNNKPGTAEKARGLLPDESVIIIAYSAGTEPAIMYTRWRWENAQKVESLVLLGPTFVSPYETGGEVLELGKFGGDSNGDWASYMEFALFCGTNILVVDDGFWLNGAQWFKTPKGATGKFEYWLKFLQPHYRNDQVLCPATNCKPEFKNEVYEWLENPTGQ